MTGRPLRRQVRSRHLRALIAAGALVLCANTAVAAPSKLPAEMWSPAAAPTAGAAGSWHYRQRLWAAGAGDAKPFAVDASGARIGRASDGTGLLRTARNANGRLGGHYSDAARTLYLDYQDTPGPFNAEDPLYGRYMGSASAWAGSAATTDAQRRQVCTTFLRNGANTAQMGNCLVAGPIVGDAAPSGMSWSQYFEGLWSSVADEPWWTYKPPSATDRYGSWHILTTNYMTYTATPGR